MYTYNTIQYNTILALRAPSQSQGLNLSRAAARGEDGVVALREGTRKIMCLKMLLKRSQGRAIANFDRDFIPY